MVQVNCFYNVCYCDGTQQLQDLLLENVFKRKKGWKDKRKKNGDEKLQFSTCHKGFCIQITILCSLDNRFVLEVCTRDAYSSCFFG